MAALSSRNSGAADRSVVITAAERNEVSFLASFRIVPRLRKPAFRGGALSRLVLWGGERPCVLARHWDVRNAYIGELKATHGSVFGRDVRKPDEQKFAPGSLRSPARTLQRELRDLARSSGSAR